MKNVISIADKDQEFKNLLIVARDFWEKKVKKTMHRNYLIDGYIKGICMKYILKQLLEAESGSVEHDQSKQNFFSTVGFAYQHLIPGPFTDNWNEIASWQTMTAKQLRSKISYLI